MKVDVEEIAAGALLVMNIVVVGNLIKGFYDVYGPGDRKCGEKMHTLVKQIKQDIVPTGK